jgi:hypothetical protein
VLCSGTKFSSFIPVKERGFLAPGSGFGLRGPENRWS